VDWHDAASKVVRIARRMGEMGINSATSGNVSVRFGNTMLITPSGADYSDMAAEDIVSMDFDGSWQSQNDQVPSSEWQLHLDILRDRAEVNAVVHSHPINATALASHRLGISSFHYMVAVAGGSDIRCAEYATFGSAELSQNVLAALAGRTACLMANHGIVACGRDLASALTLAVEVETLASQYVAARALGEPVQLTQDEMGEVLEKMQSGRGYGSYRADLARDEG